MSEAPVQRIDAVAASEAEVAMTEPDEAPPQEALVDAELLVEDVSIDGMCGVY